ncbi:MAG: hypothetical protein WBG37_05710, partial [Desulfobacterales bacterium]
LETLRQGQKVRDNVRNELIRLTSDIIKIKSVAGNSACIYLTPAHTCEIYDQRPQECRLLKCWDTEALVHSYRRNRLTRRDLIGNIPKLWDLVQTHQTRCDYARIYPLIQTLRDHAAPSKVPPELGEIIAYDAHFRTLIAEKAPQFKNQILFLLGQPLVTSLAPLGLSLKLTQTGWHIRDTGEFL